MESEENKPVEIHPESQNLVQSSEDRQTILNLVSGKANDNAKTAYQRKQAQEREKFVLINGRVTSIQEERESQKKLLSESVNYEPKFVEFLSAFCDLMGWPESVRKAYGKPYITAVTINAVVYDRFPLEVRKHIQLKNPYIRYCIRKYKNYSFLGEDNILKLETYIYDAVILMSQCKDYYEFRKEHAINFGTSFQPDLFRE